MRAVLLAGLIVLAGCGQPGSRKAQAPATPAPTVNAVPILAADAPAPPPEPTPAAAVPPSEIDDVYGVADKEREEATARFAEQIRPLQRGDDPAFDQHRTPLFKGRLARARPRGDDRYFVTRITDDSEAAGVNFAGDSSVVRVGCGTGCTFTWVVDRRSGAVHELGLGGEKETMLELVFKPDSRLIKAGWQEDGNCHYQSYVWTGERLRRVGKAVVFDIWKVLNNCPRGDD